MLNRSDITIMTSWNRLPPAVPWSALPTISIVMLTALAQRIEEMKKSATAARRIIFLPHMSENLAQIGPEAALARR